MTTIDRAVARARRLTRYGQPDATRLAAIRLAAIRPAPTPTYDEALERAIAHDVRRWGEAEREASERLNRKNYPTLGLMLNHVAHLDPDAIDVRLAAQAVLAMTADDVAILRRGG